MTNAPSEFESELRAFDFSPAPTDAVVFYGSSSFRLWDNLAQSFPGIPVVNRGFGGSTLADCIAVLPRVLLPLRPARLILYAADNDLDQGASPERALGLFRQFMERIRGHFPALPIGYVSIKPSPVRFTNIANIRRTNGLIQAAISEYPGVTYLDLFSPMLSPTGAARPELFTEDGLHMNSAGYALWSREIGAWLDAPSASASQPNCGFPNE